MTIDDYVLAEIRKNDDRKVIKIKVKDYKKFLKEKNKDKLSEFIYYRFYERYIKPFEFENEEFKKHYKSGFLIVASCCLMMEALESFYRGWEDTKGKSEKAINNFLERSSKLKLLKKIGRGEFYKNIRCAIFHQAETIGGYRILRKGKEIIDGKAINAIVLLAEIKKCLSSYKKDLEDADWDSEIWDNFRRKMRVIIKNCKS